MNEKAMVMKREIRALSGYNALIKSKFYISILLGLSSIYLMFFRYALSPLYILILLNALPPILMYILKDIASHTGSKILYSITQNNSYLLNSLKSKYRYTKLSYITNSIAYLAAILFIIVWQYDYTTWEDIDRIISYFPSVILSFGILLRFLLIIVYRIKLHHDLTNNIV